MITLHDESDRITRAGDTWSYLTRAQAAGAAPSRGEGRPRSGRPPHTQKLCFFIYMTTSCEGVSTSIQFPA